MRILLVEDDIHLAESLTEALTAQRYAVDAVRDGELAWEQMSALAYDLILMDVTLPKLDGLRLCQRMRDRGVGVPVLMLTARDTCLDKVNGLDAGADVYMVKPFDLQELLAQIRALLRRGGTAAASTLRWGSLSLDPGTYEVLYGSQPLRLTPKEFAILQTLLHHGARVLSRATLIEHAWNWEDAPEEETVKSYIKSLRSKLAAAGAPKDLIETIHGVGYRLKGAKNP